VNKQRLDSKACWTSIGEILMEGKRIVAMGAFTARIRRAFDLQWTQKFDGIDAFGHAADES
jgi:hypothetical protein